MVDAHRTTVFAHPFTAIDAAYHPRLPFMLGFELALSRLDLTYHLPIFTPFPKRVASVVANGRDKEDYPNGDACELQIEDFH